MDYNTFMALMTVGITIFFTILGSTWYLARKFQYYDDKICFIKDRLDKIEKKIDRCLEVCKYCR